MEYINTVPRWVEELCSIVSEHVGYTVRPKNVHSDELGWKYYIPSCGLYPQLPLVICDNIGELHIIIPHQTYESLERGRIRVSNFFEMSFWHYGYYRGGCDMVKAIYWQPLEGDGAMGMTDDKRIQQFFNTVSQEDMTEETATEFCPKDDRKVLMELMRAHVYSIFGFAVSDFFMYESDLFSQKVILKPASKRNIVEVYLPSDILIRLMYYPGVIDCEHFVKHTEFWLGCKYSNEQIAVPKQCENLADFCQNFWRDLRWYNDKK